MLPIAQNEWFQTIKNHYNNTVDIFALLSSYEFEQVKSPFSTALDDADIHISTITTIPQGINNSTSPHRKIFLHCSFSKEPALSSVTTIHAFTLNTDLKTQTLSRKLIQPAVVNQNDLTSLDCTVRNLYRKELQERKASGRENASDF